MTITKAFRLSLAAAFLLANVTPLSPGQEKKPDKEEQFSRQVLSLGAERIEIVRDPYGVPHVLAETNRGVYFGGGYAVAQDRLFQMERFRRDARGQLAEIEGSQAFSRDAEIRVVGYTEEQLQATFDALREDIKQSYAAYADGVNFYIKELVSSGKVPDDFKKVGINEPAPWKVTDSIAVGITMARRFGSVGGSEASNARILKTIKSKFGNDAEKVFNDLYYLNDPKAATTVPGNGKVTAIKQRNTSPRLAQSLDGDDQSLSRVNRVANQMDVYSYAASHNLPTKLGSFCYVISPAKSVSGSAMLVGCPQMGFATPQIAHEIHYCVGSLNVIGMGFAGVPGVLIGHNDHIAWSMTSGITDMTDLFAEKLNPQNKNQYLYKGKYRDLARRTEVIKVKGEKDRRIGVMRTVHGPVVDFDEDQLLKSNVVYSMAMSYAGHEFATFEAVYGFNYASNIHEFARLAGTIYTNHNFLAADDEGNIGYWHAGRPPIRARGYDPRLPAPGTGECDWLGLLPFSEMPQVINPSQGYLVNWNNKPAAGWDNGDFPTWGEAYHVAGIEKMIRSREVMSFEQARSIVEDIATRDNDAEFLKPYLMAALDKWAVTGRDGQVQRAREYLQAWDNHAVDGSVAKTLFDAWVYQLRETIFGEKFAGVKFLSLQLGLPNLYRHLTNTSMMLHILNGPRAAVPLSRDYLDGRDRDQVIIESLMKALRRLASDRGPQMNLWTFSQGEIDLNPLPGIPKTERGTYALAVELSKPFIRSTSVLPPGQSEDEHSRHYGDQRELAGYWRFKELVHRRDELEKPFQAERPSN
jgi:penicillin amidase